MTAPKRHFFKYVIDETKGMPKFSHLNTLYFTGAISEVRKSPRVAAFDDELSPRQFSLLDDFHRVHAIVTDVACRLDETENNMAGARGCTRSYDRGRERRKP